MLKRFILIVAVCLSGCTSVPNRHPTEILKPNIIFILTDDQRFDTIAALGNPGIITPNLDELARTGFVFRNAYCMGGSSGAVCVASRNMLLSGRTYFRFGRFAEADKPNIPRSFRDAGYETWHLGKRGNTADEIHKVFEHTAYLDDEKARSCGEPGKETVEAALDFLSKRDATRPFLMWFEFAVPHDPRIASPELLAMYQPEDIALPRNFLPEHPFDNGDLKVRDETLAPWPRTEDEIRRHLHEYYAVITGLDREIGRLIASLRERGELENTIIVFTSDNGLAIGSHGLMGKQNLYEEGMKVPLIVAGPGIKRGSTDAMVYLHDLFPTLCDLARLPVPDGLDGLSFAPVIHGTQLTVRKTIFLSYRHLMRAYRDERYKVIFYSRALDRYQLFDLKEDPWELNNLVDPRVTDPNGVQFAVNLEHLRMMMEQLAAEAKLAGDDYHVERYFETLPGTGQEI